MLKNSFSPTRAQLAIRATTGIRPLLPSLSDSAHRNRRGVIKGVDCHIIEPGFDDMRPHVGSVFRGDGKVGGGEFGIAVV